LVVSRRRTPTRALPLTVGVRVPLTPTYRVALTAKRRERAGRDGGNGEGLPWQLFFSALEQITLLYCEVPHNKNDEQKK